jgi:DNA repair exonuclease SbcCD ATPase subunit
VKVRKLNSHRLPILIPPLVALQKTEQEYIDEHAKSEQLSAQVQGAEAKLAEIPRLQENLTRLENGKLNSILFGVNAANCPSDVKDAHAQFESERAKVNALQERLANSDSQASDVGRLEAELAGLSSGIHRNTLSFTCRLTAVTEVKARTTELESEREKSASLSNELQQVKTELEELPKVKEALASLEAGKCGRACIYTLV